MPTIERIPPAKDLAMWFRSLSQDVRRFLREHELQVPFWYHGEQAFIDGALANDDVQTNAELWPEIWSEETIRGSPPRCWEFEHVLAFGGFDVLGWAKGKSGWGRLLWVAPLRPDDPQDPEFLCCTHKVTSPYMVRRNQRDWMKQRIGRRWRSLVTYAFGHTKREFLAKLAELEGQTKLARAALMPKVRPDMATDWHPPVPITQADVVQSSETQHSPTFWIRRRLGCDLCDFWRAAKGRLVLARPKRPKQLLLFAQ